MVVSVHDVAAEAATSAWIKSCFENLHYGTLLTTPRFRLDYLGLLRVQGGVETFTNFREHSSGLMCIRLSGAIRCRCIEFPNPSSLVSESAVSCLTGLLDFDGSASAETVSWSSPDVCFGVNCCIQMIGAFSFLLRFFFLRLFLVLGLLLRGSCLLLV